MATKGITKRAGHGERAFWRNGDAAFRVSQFMRKRRGSRPCGIPAAVQDVLRWQPAPKWVLVSLPGPVWRQDFWAKSDPKKGENPLWTGLRRKNIFGGSARRERKVENAALCRGAATPGRPSAFARFRSVSLGFFTEAGREMSVRRGETPLPQFLHCRRSPCTCSQFGLQTGLVG
jgi:hypothetical protein